MVSFWTEPFLILKIFWKNTCKKEKVRKNCFDGEEKPQTYLKILRKKTKFSKPLEPFSAFQSLKFFPSANHGGRHFFETLAPTTILVLLRHCDNVVSEVKVGFSSSQEVCFICFNESPLIRPEPCKFIKKEILAQVFPVNLAKLSRTPFLKNTFGRLLL